LERAILICGKEIVDSSGKGLCLDDHHGSRIRQWRRSVKEQPAAVALLSGASSRIDRTRALGNLPKGLGSRRELSETAERSRRIGNLPRVFF
jgi:hypothetical protein